MVELANGQDPDVVFLTGDYIIGRRKFIHPWRGFKKSKISFRSTRSGDHDIRVDADGITEPEKAQIKVLRNSSESIDLKRDSCGSLELNEYSCGQSDIPKACGRCHSLSRIFVGA